MKAAVIEETAPTATSPVQRERGVAVGGEVVDDDVGDLAEALAARVLGRHPGGVLEAGHGDDAVARLLRLEREADDGAVDAGVAGDEEDVGRGGGGELPQGVDDGRLALEGRGVGEDRRS